MKLTDENQDCMDCRPLGRKTGKKTPAWLQEIKDKMKAEKAPPSEKPPTPDAAEWPGLQ